MRNALIKDNKPMCPSCEESSPNLLKIFDADAITVQGERYFEMKMKCHKCDTKSYYFLSLSLERRMSLDKKNDATYQGENLDVEQD